MGFNKSPRSFNDVYEILERAMASPKGIKIPCASRGVAMVLRTRINYWRKTNRRDNRDTYDVGHPLHNCSIYDKFTLRIPKAGELDENVLYIEIRSADDLTIEEIK